ncbi:8634_t:CDS:2 [Paraglomus brasilianum]|uniref:8634_t:CDS:1 n=1 Tax=Paraglomus brasilianum TaxID=144538 RepID=A0A9N9BUN0_9GLOM|nr:8634_t:CDS:2 [Paraglomus brasilianum]
MDQLTSLTVWDVKDVFNKVKNAVMNYTEMEAKVREATNNEPWGASSTLMLEIAQATYNYQYFNEVMPTIYKRFTEKEARQWRQIYKALVLLEFLVKNGSERVVDDARAHMATIKIMRDFTYIDEKGKDQGINVRNRAKELAELLSEVDRIRAERKKARANRQKYTSVSSDSLGYTGGFGGSSSRYGGYGNDSYSSYSEYIVELSWSFVNNERKGEYDDRSMSSSRSRYDDYDSPSNPSRSSSGSDRRSSRITSMHSRSSSLAEVADNDTLATTSSKKVEPVLVSFGDKDSVEVKGTKSTTGHKPNVSIDDDFDDFQSATTIPSTTSTRKSVLSPSLVSTNTTTTVTPAKDLIDDILSGPIIPSGGSNNTRVGIGIANNNFTNNPSSNITPLNGAFGTKPLIPVNTSTPPHVANNFNSIKVSGTQANSSSSFQKLKSDDIWVQASNLVSLDSLSLKDTPTTNKSTAPSMNSLAMANANNISLSGTWGTGRGSGLGSGSTMQMDSGAKGKSQSSADPFDLL